MEPITVLIAQLFGPVLIAMGAGIFFNRNYYSQVYRDLEKETLAVFVTGIATLVVGIAIVTNHNLWDSFAAGFISLIGWLSIAKGIALLVFPRWIDGIAEWVANSMVFAVAGVAAAAVGAYITWVGYFM